ncbi:Por secretion system C-terminal sorting domain-containing protein [Algoriphagus faecimaris]|uniref:Por secretion system C-terminal sorting domain-containing protein n=1 Tax=Algoriphagus faecimaris TaxID=686796 RepID=A0A1G6R7G5_9BACT|nr:T9SS type A sorting domain-containing protein [Algoriphagus faecimaris]SDC99826.1 Por secretion system C-terminal sorting domain-containing protein [Algoriphagus faecimaris]
MKDRDKLFDYLALFESRIYRILSAIGLFCLLTSYVFSQEIGAYRTVGSGDFQNLTIWEVFDGFIWNAAANSPNQTNDIYIDQTHTLSLSQNEAVKSVFINAEAGAGQKLNLNGFNLDIYGTLQAFNGAAPGTPIGAWNSQNWIGNSTTSTLTFRGNSRTIIPLDAWSGFSTNSRYAVIFDPGPGVELRIQEAFKALSFTIRSGTVIQELDTSVIPNNCPTLSFNTETTVYGPGPFGELIIEDGATFITNCNDDISFRSGTVSSNSFDLRQGGTLILEGENPLIEAASIQLNGTVIHRSGSSTKNFLSKSFTDAATPQSIRNLILEGNEDLILPSNLIISGNLIQSGTGEFLSEFSHLQFLGATDQLVQNFSLETRDLTLNKMAGELIVDEDLRILQNLNLIEGSLNLAGNELHVNLDGSGEINYLGGSWKNISLFTYHNTPTVLDAINGTFPFEDTQNEGIRKVQLLGASSGGDLSIQFSEFKGADLNAGFDDSDGTTILYRLYSYFEFSGLNPSSNSVELRISADKLIVDDEEDLRIVGTGYAAPGTHLIGLDPTVLWARRALTFDELAGVNFTVGSFRTLTILPINWLSLEVKNKDQGALLQWQVAEDHPDGHYSIFRSSSANLNTEKQIGELRASSDEGRKDYEFYDSLVNPSLDYYYRIKYTEPEKEENWSKLLRLAASSTSSRVEVYPNPYTQGEIFLSIPANWNIENIQVEIHKLKGTQIFKGYFDEILVTEKLKKLSPGIYLIRITHWDQSEVIRWVRH